MSGTGVNAPRTGTARSRVPGADAVDDARRRALPALRALGRGSFPPGVEIDGRVYTFERGLKHDFFAATALYACGAGKIVLKIGRRAHFLGVPLGWIGRFLARHEAHLYRRFADLEVVPRFVGMWGDDAIAHEYVAGHVLRKNERVADDYFARLRRALEVMHSRDVAYVDLEKCENVLVGDDGRPYLFDFQISWFLPRKYGGHLPPARWLLNWLQQGDLYHLRKLQRRTRPDQLTEAELAESYRRPFHVHLHGWLTRPLQRARRAVLARIDPSSERGERGRFPDEPA